LPIFKGTFSQNNDGITFGYLQKNSLYLVMTTRFNVPPAIIMELLLRISKVSFHSIQ
jgi:hypothetical protein